MELAVQVDFGAHTTVQKTPDGGFYILAADCSAGRRRRREGHGLAWRLGKTEGIETSVRDWATGVSTNCPDRWPAERCSWRS